MYTYKARQKDTKDSDTTGPKQRATTVESKIMRRNEEDEKFFKTRESKSKSPSAVEINKRSSTLEKQANTPTKKDEMKRTSTMMEGSGKSPTIEKRGSTLYNNKTKSPKRMTKPDLNRRGTGLSLNPERRNSKRILFSFKRTTTDQALNTKVQERKHKREPLDVYLDYLNNKDISTITSEHIYLFDLFKIAQHFNDNEVIEKIHDYIDENIDESTIPLFILEIINQNQNFNNTFEEVFEEMDEEWKGCLTKIIEYFNADNMKELTEALKNELELFLLENENISIQKIDFLVFLLSKIPYFTEKAKVLLMSVFLRHFAKLQGKFNTIIDNTLGKDFLIKNKDIVKEIYTSESVDSKDVKKDLNDGESIIYRNLMNKAEAKYKQKVSQLDELMKQQLFEVSRRIDEYKAYNEELVQKNLTSEKDIISLKHNVINLTKDRDRFKSMMKDENFKSNSDVIHEIKLEFEAMKNQLRLNSDKIDMLEREKQELMDSNETLTRKSKKNKKISLELKSQVDALEKTIETNNKLTKTQFDTNFKEINSFIKLLSCADDNFGNLSKELDSIKLYLQKEYSEHENTKKSNNILRLLNSQMEERFKNAGITPVTTTNQAFGIAKSGNTSNKFGTNPTITVKKDTGRPSAKPKEKNKTLSFSVKKSFQPTSQQINCVTNISYGSTEIIAAGGTDNLIKLYNLEYWDVIASLSGHRDFISCLLFLNEFQPLLISGSADRTIKIWKLSNNSCIQNIIAHAGAILCLLYIGKSLIVSGSGDKSMKIWNIDNGACVRKIDSHLNYVTSLVSLFPFKKNLIASGSWDSTIKVWEFDGDDDTICTLKGHESSVNCLLYIDNWDKELLISGSKDNSIKLWNVRSNELVNTSKGHEAQVTCLMSLTSVESSTRVSGSEDKTLRIWYLTSGDCISVIKTEHAFGIKAMLKVDLKRKDKDEKEEKECFISVGNDKVIKLWQLD